MCCQAIACRKVFLLVAVVALLGGWLTIRPTRRSPGWPGWPSTPREWFTSSEPRPRRATGAGRRGVGQLVAKRGQGQPAPQDLVEASGAGDPRPPRRADRRDAVPGRAAPGPLRLLLSRKQGHRLGRSGGRLGGRLPAASWGSPAAGPSCSCRTWSWRCGRFRPAAARDADDRLLDRSDPGGAGRDAALPAEQPARFPSEPQTVRAKLCGNSLGLQLVSINGVSPKTHFAQVMVEADYRMKLIGIGLERPPVRLVSYVDRAKPSEVGRNALQRWFFVPDYQCVRVSDDNLAMELVGDGVKLIGEDEMVTASGQRQTAGRATRPARRLSSSFTRRYPELAERSPVYAELRNLIDLADCRRLYPGSRAITARPAGRWTFLATKGFPWKPTTCRSRSSRPSTPIWKGSTLMTPIGGGVQIEARAALRPENLLQDEKDKLDQAHNAVSLPAGRWWWD